MPVRLFLVALISFLLPFSHNLTFVASCFTPIFIVLWLLVKNKCSEWCAQPWSIRCRQVLPWSFTPYKSNAQFGILTAEIHKNVNSDCSAFLLAFYLISQHSPKDLSFSLTFVCENCYVIIPYSSNLLRILKNEKSFSWPHIVTKKEEQHGIFRSCCVKIYNNLGLKIFKHENQYLLHIMIDSYKNWGIYWNTGETDNAWEDETKPLRLKHNTKSHLVSEILKVQIHENYESMGDVLHAALFLILSLATARGQDSGRVAWSAGYSSVLTGAKYPEIHWILYPIKSLISKLEVFAEDCTICTLNIGNWGM